MINGRLSITKMNLMGFTAETQMYIIQNVACNAEIKNGSNNNFKFLQDHSRFFDHTSDGLCLVATRMPAFRKYCEEQGFELVDK